MSAEDSDESRNYTKTVGTRLTPQTKRQFDNYRDENELGKTAAARRLIREALDDTDETLDTVNKASILAGAAYLVVYLVGGPTPTVAVGGVFIAFLILWSTYPKVAATDGEEPS
jgi:hypothetical protein